MNLQTGDVNILESAGNTYSLNNVHMFKTMNISAKKGGKVNIGHLTLEPTGHLNVSADGGIVNIQLKDLTNGKGVSMSSRNGG